MGNAFNGAWLASILSAILVCAGQALVTLGQKRISERMERDSEDTRRKREAEAEWRDRIESRMNEQDERIESVLRGQCTQMRSDVVHRAHRYLDDLGKASTEEKAAFWSEYEEYCGLCEQYGIENNFVDTLAERVMALPERNV